MFGLLYCLPLLFKVLQKGGSCSDCYFVYRYSLRFGLTEEWFLLLLLYCLTILFNV